MRSISVLILISFLQLPDQSDQSQIIQAVIASTVELPCATRPTIETSNPAKIIWIRDDHADIVSLDSDITIRDPRLSILAVDSIDRQERVLRIANIEEQDHGLYRCIHGDTTLSEIFLDVLIPPRIISHSPEHMHLTVKEGRDAQFSCTAFGRPAPVIIWHVNGLSRPATVDSNADKNESILILHNVSRFDTGRVDCSARNALTTVNRQFLLHVKYKPIVTVPFHVSYFRLHDSATITCRSCSIPSAMILDFFRPKQNHPVTQGVKDRFDQFINQTCRQITITIYLSDESFFGNYVCRARNSIGISHADFVLKELVSSTKRMNHIHQTSTKSHRLIVSSSSTISIEAKDQPDKQPMGLRYKSNTIQTQDKIETNRGLTLSTSSLFMICLLFVSSRC